MPLELPNPHRELTTDPEQSSLDCEIVALIAAMSEFDLIGKARHSSVEQLLDSFNDAAARGDLEAYFGCFLDASRSRFLGTDVKENWTAGEFLSFARPHFNGKPAWIYIPLEGKRTIDYFSDGSLATFEEHLTSVSFKATSRGSGTCVRNEEGNWHIIHYYLSFPIPNELAKSFCASIAKWETAQLTQTAVDSTKAAGSGAPQAPLATAKEVAELEAKVAVERELRRKA